MTHSEQHLRVGTVSREVGRVWLRKHLVTDYQQVTVPVSQKEVRIEREPITEANRGAAYDGPALSEEEHENETVSGNVCKEQIELDDSELRTGHDVEGRVRR